MIYRMKQLMYDKLRCQHMSHKDVIKYVQRWMNNENIEQVITY